MAGDGKRQDGEQHSTEKAIADFRATADRTIGEWSDAQLDAVIVRLRQDGTRQPDSFSLLMFLEDARLRRHELRAQRYTDGKGTRPDITLS